MNGLHTAQRSYDKQIPMDCAAPEMPSAADWDASLRKLVMTEENFPGIPEKASEYVANDIPGHMTEADAVDLLRAALSNDDYLIVSIIKRLARKAISINASSLADE